MADLSFSCPGEAVSDSEPTTRFIAVRASFAQRTSEEEHGQNVFDEALNVASYFGAESDKNGRLNIAGQISALLIFNFSLCTTF